MIKITSVLNKKTYDQHPNLGPLQHPYSHVIAISCLVTHLHLWQFASTLRSCDQHLQSSLMASQKVNREASREGLKLLLFSSIACQFPSPPSTKLDFLASLSSFLDLSCHLTIFSSWPHLFNSRILFSSLDKQKLHQTNRHTAESHYAHHIKHSKIYPHFLVTRFEAYSSPTSMKWKCSTARV